MIIKKFSAAACSMTLISFGGLAVAQSQNETFELQKAGFVLEQPDLWVSEKGDVVQRIGIGEKSNDALLSRLEEQLSTLEARARRSDASILLTLTAMNSIEQIRSAIEFAPRASGNNGCSAATHLLKAEVSVTDRSASASVGPAFINVPTLQLGMALASSSTSPYDLSFDGAAATAPSIAAYASVPSGGAQCKLYSVIWETRTADGCASWKDAYYSGPC